MLRGMGRWLLALIAVTAWAAGAAWWFREPLTDWLSGRDGTLEANEESAGPWRDAETYAVLASELARWHGELAERHRRARSETERTAVEHDARVILEQVLPEMMRCWLGTPWDYNGTASMPGEDGIACGYYVATVLRDAGFRLDRYQLAKQPSENILRSFLDRPSCVLTVGKDYDVFADDLDSAEPGIYLVGLDTHVAFIVTGHGDGFRFIHASGSDPWRVVDEDRDEALVLQRSRWRMLGNLTAEPKVIRRWLRGERIVVRGAGAS